MNLQLQSFYLVGCYRTHYLKDFSMIFISDITRKSMVSLEEPFPSPTLYGVQERFHFDVSLEEMSFSGSNEQRWNSELRYHSTAESGGRNHAR